MVRKKEICPFCNCEIKYPKIDTPSGRNYDALGNQWGVCSEDCNPFGGLV